MPKKKQVNKNKNKGLRVLQMLVMPTKTDLKNLEEFIEELRGCCDLEIDYSFKDKILNIKSKDMEYIIYCDKQVDCMNFLTGFKSALLDFNNCYMRLTPVKKESKNESSNG